MSQTCTRTSRRAFVASMLAGAGALAADWKGLQALAAEVRPKSDYPVVVIGAGIGGLAAAAYLAKAGFPVTVLERQDQPGGYAVSFERRGFRFDVAPHYTLALGPMLGELGVADKVELVDASVMLHAVGPRIDLELPPRDPEGAARVLVARYPGEADAIRGYLAELRALLSEWRTPVADPAGMSSTHPTITRLSAETAQQLLDRHFRDPELKGLLMCLGASYGMPPSLLTGFSFQLGAAANFLTAGKQYLRRRPLDLAGALAEAIGAHGGRIRYDTEASRILAKDGAVTGVRSASGVDHPARIVVSNASAPATFGRLLPPDAVPAAYLQRIRSARVSASSFKVWLGLNQSLREKVRGHSHIVLPAGVDWEAAATAARSGDVSGAGMTVYVYDSVDPGTAPAGKSTVGLLLLCPYEPWRRFEADYLAGRKDAYRQEKERVASLLIDRAERWVLPGLRSMIEVREAATPLTNLRYTGNPDGAILGYDCVFDNCGRTRIRNRTPVRGLYLAGAWGDPGGGINPVMRGAQLAFRAIVEDLGGT